MSIINKRVLVGLPDPLYKEVKRLAEENYKSVSGFIRECIFDKINYDNNFSKQEYDLIDKGVKEAKISKGVSWRDLRNDI